MLMLPLIHCADIAADCAGNQIKNGILNCKKALDRVPSRAAAGTGTGVVATQGFALDIMFSEDECSYGVLSAQLVDWSARAWLTSSASPSRLHAAECRGKSVLQDLDAASMS